MLSSTYILPSQVCIENVLDFFSLFCLFLVAYGYKLRIWEGSKTTLYVILYATYISFSLCRVQLIALVISTVVFLLALFARAIWKKRDFINVQY